MSAQENSVEKVNCVDERAMQALGASLISRLEKDGLGNERAGTDGIKFARPKTGGLITLRGELGAGKSFLARAMIHAAGHEGRVKSPTYTLVETYEIAQPANSIARIAHLDLYRLADPDELQYLAFDDVLFNSDLVIIEWPERASGLLPAARLDVSIEYADNGGREVELLWS